MHELTIYYRGSLRGCNYACRYCPFAGEQGDDRMRKQDATELQRFVTWCETCEVEQLTVFFTPRGEALIHPWYRDAIVQLSRLPIIVKIAAQTNLSFDVASLTEAKASRVGLWCTYHPSQVSADDFLAQCEQLDAIGIGYSVGMVASSDSYDAAVELRRRLPDHVYLWLNADKETPERYDESSIARWSEIDPHFRLNLPCYPSAGQPCRTGRTVLAVEGDGTARRCWFVDQPLGNLYTDRLDQLTTTAPCPRPTCDCHIGFVNLESLNMPSIFGPGLPERRIPGFQAKPM